MREVTRKSYRNNIKGEQYSHEEKSDFRYYTGPADRKYRIDSNYDV